MADLSIVDSQPLPAGGLNISKTEPLPRPATSGSMALDFMQGGGAELIGTALGAYNLLRKIPGADKVLPAVSPDVQQYAEPPKTAAAKIGGLFTSLGEFALPAGEAAGLTKGAGLAARALAQGAATGGVEALRTGGDVNKSIDAAALGAAGPVVGAGIRAAAPILKTSGVGTDLIGVVSPRAAHLARLGGKIANAMGSTAEKAAPAAETVAEDEDQQMLAAIQRGQQNAASQAASAAPKAYQPRPPEYYGVKPEQTPPTTPANNPPAPSTAPEVSAAPPAPANVQPIRPEAPAPEPPAPKTASGAIKANAQAKADRFVQAIRRFNSDNPQQALSANELSIAGDEEKSMLTRALKQGGYLGNETFTDKSFPYIVQKLKDAETAASQTIKPPAGFSLGSMKQYTAR